MKQSVSFPVYNGCMEEYGSAEGLRSACAHMGVDGLELIWGETDYTGQSPQGLAVGYHLVFWPDWLDFWLGDEDALQRKFGSRQVWETYYGGCGRADMLRQYRADMARAADLGAEYVVMHVSDVSIQEGYTYRWLHTDEAVIDAVVQLVNQLTEGTAWPFHILLENQWWPGFTFTDPKKTDRLLRGVRSPKKGLLLDTGHLMNTNLALRTQTEAVAYIHRCLDRHGSLCAYIKGVHLHQSISGAYVRSHTGFLPEGLPTDYWELYAANYGHILQIDQHAPWTEPAIAGVIQRIAPLYLTHELAAGDRVEREAALATQRQTLRLGGLHSVNR